MRIHDFNELSGIDFHLTYFNVSTTLETPQRTYRCHKSLRPYDRFYYIDEGIFTITEDGYDTMTLTSGDLLYLPADCTYSSAWKSEEISYYSVIFSLAENRSGEKFSLSDRIEYILHDHGDVTVDLMRRIWTTRTRGGIASNMKSWSLFFELLQLATVEKDVRQPFPRGIPQIRRDVADTLPELSAREKSRRTPVRRRIYGQRSGRACGNPRHGVFQPGIPDVHGRKPGKFREKGRVTTPPAL